MIDYVLNISSLSLMLKKSEKNSHTKLHVNSECLNQVWGCMLGKISILISVFPDNLCFIKQLLVLRERIVLEYFFF